jgi:hypothetical protein
MIASTDTSFDAAAIVEEFLRIILVPDPDGARRFVSPDIVQMGVWNDSAKWLLVRAGLADS